MNPKQDEVRRIILAVLLAGCALFLSLCFFSFSPYDPTFGFAQIGLPTNPTPSNFGGRVGSYLAGLLMFLLGNCSYLIVIVILIVGWNTIWGDRERPISKWVVWGSSAGLILSIAAALGLREASGTVLPGGVVGAVCAHGLAAAFGEKGSILILSFLIAAFVAAGYRLYLEPIWNFFRDAVIERSRRPPLPVRRTKPRPAVRMERQEPQEQPAVSHPAPEEPPPPKPASVAKPAPKRTGKSAFTLPGIDLLKVGNPTQKETKEDLDTCAQVIEETLAEFGIEGEVVQINQGPRVTMYEVKLSPGIRVQRVHEISDNIAMSLKTTTIRIVAPLPGRSTIGIEVPNREISIVYLREIVGSREFASGRSKLTVAIGKDIMGRPIISDLKLMPHLLIAGETGSGKTVCINSLVVSILYKADPDEVKFILIDPKMVELTFYDELPHLLLPVVKDVKEAILTLRWLTIEMERRYKLFAAARARNIDVYNAADPEEPLPYIVVVIDELADLMSLARKEIENSVIRLSQLARAAGIHLILATQRPSVNVITGVIKANLPCRIAFQVPSKFDSRTILDSIGAEKLLGRGDCLFIPPGASRPLRLQGTYVSDEEIEGICEFLKLQREPEYRMEILQEAAEAVQASGAGVVSGGVNGEADLYEQAKRIVIDTGIASISMLQRRLKVGFNKAAGLIEQMEKEGIVGPYQEAGKPRQVLVKDSGRGKPEAG